MIKQQTATLFVNNFKVFHQKNPPFLPDLCNVSKWLFILHQHLSKLQALFWVDPHHIPEQKDPVWSVAHLEPKKLIKINLY